MDGIFFVWNNKSLNGKFVVAIRASDIGAVLVGFRARNACNGP